VIYLFAGPTLAPEVVTERLPEAAHCPPIKHGDLLRLDPRRGDVVAIVDGYFRQETAIRHKEILDALERGVHVCGASGMGALRAAELHPFGMLGIGSIFEMLVSGEIDGDDEVSLAHAEAGDGYQPLSEALVDIRRHCRQALEAGVITQDDADAITAAASALAYDERVYTRVLAQARSHGLQAAASEAYLTFVEREGRSARVDDALALVDHLLAGPPAPSASFELAETHWFYMAKHARRGWQDAAEPFITDRVVLNFVRVAARDYPDVHERVALEELGAFYSEHLGLDVPDAGELIEQFRDEAGLQPEDAWLAWCAERRLREDELEASLLRRARLRAVTGVSGALDLEQLRQLASDYAVALGLWPEGEAPEEQLALWLTEEERERLSSVEQVARVAVRTFRLYPSTPPDAPFVAELKLSGTFADARAILIDRPPLPQARPPAKAVLGWCAARWGGDGVTPASVLDRGLGFPMHYAQGQSLAGPLAKRARGFYARVEASGDFLPIPVHCTTPPASAPAPNL